SDSVVSSSVASAACGVEDDSCVGDGLSAGFSEGDALLVGLPVLSGVVLSGVVLSGVRAVDRSRRSALSALFSRSLTSAVSMLTVSESLPPSGQSVTAEVPPTTKAALAAIGATRRVAMRLFESLRWVRDKIKLPSSFVTDP